MATRRVGGNTDRDASRIAKCERSRRCPDGAGRHAARSGLLPPRLSPPCSLAPERTHHARRFVPRPAESLVPIVEELAEST